MEAFLGVIILGYIAASTLHSVGFRKHLEMGFFDVGFVAGQKPMYKPLSVTIPLPSGVTTTLDTLSFKYGDKKR